MTKTQRLSTRQVRASMADLVNRVVYGSEYVVIRRGNRDMAAIVSMEDYELLQRLKAKEGESSEKAAS